MVVPVEEPLRRVRMSWEEFLELPERPRAEWVDGEAVINVAPAKFAHGAAVGRLIVYLSNVFPDRPLVTEVGLYLPGNRLRAPDLILLDKRPIDGDGLGEHGWLSAVPLLVVEVLAPSTRAEDTIRKSMDYLRGGVGQYWVVDPELRAIDVWRSVDDEWVLAARVDEKHPSGQVELGGVSVPLELATVLPS